MTLSLTNGAADDPMLSQSKLTPQKQADLDAMGVLQRLMA